MFGINSVRRNRAGFTLVELAVVVIIIGVLAAFGVPRFRDSVERSKASEAYGYLTSVVSAQERYHARQGTYADVLAKLDITLPDPKYFSVGSIAPATSGTLEDSWKLTLTRAGASAGYGAYTVTFNLNGFDPGESTITAKPTINPMGT